MTRVTVWDSRVDHRTVAPSELVRTPDVLVVGGGVIGLAVAVACRRAGLGDVVVLEREPRLAAGASGGNAGAIAPDMHVLTDDAAFVAFGRRSRELYRAWDAGFGLFPTRWLNIFPPGAALEVSRQRFTVPGSLPPSFRLLSAADVRDLEPDVRIPDGGAAVLVEGQLGVDPHRLVAGLTTLAGQVAVGVTMRGVTMRGDRIHTVHTSSGDFTPGAVVVATGLVPPPWDAGVRQRWVKGHMAAVAPGPWRLGSVLAGPLGGGAPLPDGTIVCGGTFDEDQTLSVVPAVADALVADLARVLPGVAGVLPSHRWCCLRPQIEGRQPVVDRLPGVANGWFAGGHFTTGVMMAAATGEAIAAWVAHATRPPQVATFDLPVAS